MPRASSSSRRHIRARASGVRLKDTQLFAPIPSRPKLSRFSLATPIWVATWEVRSIKPAARLHRASTPADAMEWGLAWATKRKAKRQPWKWEIVQTSESLYSSASEVEDEHGELSPATVEGQPEPSTPDYVESVIMRAREILAELASRAPYGPVTDYIMSLEWIEWVAENDADPIPGQVMYWSTVSTPRPLHVIGEMASNIYELLERGSEAASLTNYLHPGAGACSWIEITKLDIKWMCAPPTEGAERCEPTERIENEDTLGLVGERRARKATKRRRRKSKRKAHKKKAKRAGRTKGRKAAKRKRPAKKSPGRKTKTKRRKS